MTICFGGVKSRQQVKDFILRAKKADVANIRRNFREITS